jgi:hypothetical protein
MQDRKMQDRKVLEEINALAHEEHELFERQAAGHASQEDNERLREIQAMLDQCWDFLRQRRAKRDVGADPDEAEMRSAHTVETYLG